MIKISNHSIDEILPLLGQQKRANLSGYSVKVTSLRLRTFVKRGTKCSKCKLEATHFSLEKTMPHENPHLNLYGIKDGKEVLFTHDHTLARSLGGKNSLKNTTTMCTSCNGNKAKIENKILEQRRKDL